MSARGYEVVIRLKDSPLLKQLQRMEQEGVRLGTAMGGVPTKQFDVITKQMPAQTGLLQKIFGGGVGQLLKLAGISFGIGALVGLMTKSSGILAANFKLWETTILLMIKPIADFIGLLLRPISLILLTASLAFYRIAGPFFTDWGKKIAEDITLFFTDPWGALIKSFAESPAFQFSVMIDKAVDNLIKGIKDAFKFPEFKLPDITLEIGKLFAFATEALQKSWDAIVNFFTDAWAWVISGGTFFWNTIANFFTTAGTVINNVLFEAWNTIANFFGDVWAAVVSTLQPAWNTIVTTFSQIASTIQAILQKIQQLLSSIGLGGGGGPKAPTRTGGRQFGGMITEPELTFGLRTGRFGIQGEAGPEFVGPASMMSKTFNINMNIGGIVDTVNLAHERAKLRTTINAIADTL